MYLTRKIAVSLALLALAMFGGGSAWAGVVLNENFDSYNPGDFPAGWVLVWSGDGSAYQVVTDSESVSSPNSFTMLGRSGNSAVAEYVLPSTPQQITFGASMRVKDGATTGDNGGLSLWNRHESTWGVYYCRVRFNDTAITLDNQYIMNYNRNQWYLVEVEYDAGTRLASVWIDGGLEANQWPVYSGGVGYTALAMACEHGAIKSYFDDVVVSVPDPPPAAAISLDHVTGQTGPGQIAAGVPIDFSFRLENYLGEAVKGLRNGFRVYSPDGATWQPITYDTVSWGWPTMFDGGVFIQPYGVTGTGADTIGFGAVAIFGPGIPDGFNEEVWSISTQVFQADAGLHLCIDSTYYPPIDGWYWDTGTEQVVPQWDGPHCYEIVSNQPPAITNLPPPIVDDHCNFIVYDFDAVDPEGDSLWFELLGGPGTIESVTGVWTWMPDIADVGYAHTLELRVCDAYGCEPASFVDIEVTNQAPFFTSGCGDSLTVIAGNILNHALGWAQPDCDPVTFTVIDAMPVPLGMAVVDPATGLFEFATDPADLGHFTFLVEVTDGADFDVCEFYVEVLSPAPMADYGDAPDSVGGSFPTRYYTSNSRFGQPGAHHLSVAQEVLGYSVSSEAGVEDPLDTDGVPNLIDEDGHDDGITSLTVWSWGGMFGRSKSVLMAKTRVTVAAGAPDTIRYLNILFDANGDLEWKNCADSREWLLINYPIGVTPGQSAMFWLDLGLVPDSSVPMTGYHNWMRATLSRTPIDVDSTVAQGGWDGSGAFDYGETEDYRDIPREGPPNFWLKARLEKNPVIVKEGNTGNIIVTWEKGGPDKDTLMLHWDLREKWGWRVGNGHLPGCVRGVWVGDYSQFPFSNPPILPTWEDLVTITQGISGTNPANPLDDCKQNFSIKYNLLAFIPSLGWNFGSQKICDVIIDHRDPGPGLWGWFWGWFNFFFGGDPLLQIWDEDSTEHLANVILGDNRDTGGQIAMIRAHDYPPCLEGVDLEGVLPVYWMGMIEFDPDFDADPPVNTDIAAVELFGYTDDMVTEAGIIDESTIEVFRMPLDPELILEPCQELTYYVGSDVTIDPDNNIVTISDPTGFGLWGLRGEVVQFTCEIVGDMNHDGVGPDIVDLVYMVTYMFQDGPPPVCMEEADINGDEVGPDIADLVYLVTWMFSDGPPPVPCY